jgi:hypothetical protein
MPTVGIIANPAAGKDIRRLVSAASPVSDMAKIGIIRRAAVGAVEGGAGHLVLADDRHALARRAIDATVQRALDRGRGRVEVLDLPLLSSSGDSTRAAAAMADRAVDVMIVLGGDGTHRDVAKGWRHGPMVALSTGTNNVFPRAMEATTAGQAAGAVASEAVRLDDVSWPALVIDAEIRRSDGSVEHDLALVDVGLTDGAFTGSRAVWDLATLRDLVAVIAEPDAVGLSAIAAAVAPTGRRDPEAIHVSLSRDGSRARCPVRCAVAPGRYDDVAVDRYQRLPVGRSVTLAGPGVLSFDGERDVVLESGDEVELTVAADGPPVIDVAKALMATRPEFVGSGGPDGS